jgi:hypothetical protein
MDCGDFETQTEAQEFHETHTGHRLDGDDDGIAVSRFPNPLMADNRWCLADEALI